MMRTRPGSRSHIGADQYAPVIRNDGLDLRTDEVLGFGP
jgi:hypothetical protein